MLIAGPTTAGNNVQTARHLIVADTPTPLVASHAVMGGLFALLGGILTLLLRDKGEPGA